MISRSAVARIRSKARLAFCLRRRRRTRMRSGLAGPARARIEQGDDSLPFPKTGDIIPVFRRRDNAVEPGPGATTLRRKPSYVDGPVGKAFLTFGPAWSAAVICPAFSARR